MTLEDFLVLAATGALAIVTVCIVVLLFVELFRE